MTDAQWAVVEPLLPVRAPVLGGRPRRYSPRLVIDTISCVLVSGCAWRMVPRDLVPWSTAYRWFAAWTADGTWARVHDVLRDRVRVADGRDPQPSAAVLDSQSACSAEGGAEIGYDAGKRVRGRKRHLLVDSCGLELRAVVHSASVQDRAGAKLVLAGLHREFPQVGLVWVDGGYVHSVDARLIDWAHEHEQLEVVCVPRNADVKGFQVLPRRWVVERTFAWISRCRRLARDHERKTSHSEAMLKVAMIRLMAARLAGEQLPAPRSDVEKVAARRLAGLRPRRWCTGSSLVSGVAS
ncbi:IS5-like element ISMac15 family transposase [Pseudonocardia tropica]